MKQKLQKLINSLVLIYLKLSFTDSQYSYYSSYDKENPEDVLPIVITELKAIQKSIAECLTKHLQNKQRINNDDKIQDNVLDNLEGRLIRDTDKNDSRLSLESESIDDIVINFNKLLQKAITIEPIWN